MDIKELSTEICSSAQDEAQKNDTSVVEELARKYLDTMCEYGEIASYEICSLKRSHAALTAYSYNEELQSLDLFLYYKPAATLGKISHESVYEKYESLYGFYREALREKPFFGALLDSDVQSAISLVKEVKGKIKRMRLYFLTNGIVDQPSSLNTSEYLENDGLVVEYSTWDIVRFNRVNSLNAGDDAVEIDFLNNFKKKIQCLRVEDENPKIDAYFAIMPGDILAKIYGQYKQTLMENNVRLFLQKTNRVNRQMCKTIKERPEMFFSFNNGISATAKRVEFGAGGTKTAPFITKITDLQIVNGGQTTATIAAMQECDLSKVFVPMKISVIKDDVEYLSLVKDISTSANSQSAIKRSDFLSGDECLQKLEKISRQEEEPKGKTKWYFERKRGQYKNDLANRVGYERALFAGTYPKSQIIDKSEVARLATLWDMRPYDACRSKEVVSISFFNSLKENNSVNIDAAFYRNIVALHILYNEINSYVKKNFRSSFGTYVGKVTSYIMSSISYLTERKFDLNFIWEQQKVHEKIIKAIRPLAKLVAEYLYGDGPWLNIKDQNCWKSFVDTLNDNPLLKNSLSEIPEKIKKNENRPQTQSSQIHKKESVVATNLVSPVGEKIIDDAFSILAPTWNAIAEWGRCTGYLSVAECLTAKGYARKRMTGERLQTVDMAQCALELYRKAKFLGFQPSSV